MKNRASYDRRAQSVKVQKNKRKSLRRQEDIEDSRAYGFVLGLSVATFLFIAVISFVWGR